MVLFSEKAHLSLALLGSFRATLGRQLIRDFESNRVRALLTYLAIEAERPLPREKLLGLFWPDWPEQAARNNLRSALSNLRKSIGDRDAIVPFLDVSRQEIHLNKSADAWVDAWEFERLLDSSSSDAVCIEEALALYGGEFLEGFSLGDSPAFEEWLLLKREHFRRQFLSALRRLAEIYQKQGDHERCLSYIRRIIELEPWSEEAHRQLMRSLALNGQRTAALAQYETCRQALAQELHVEPSAETIQLYEQIRDEKLATTNDISTNFALERLLGDDTLLVAMEPGRTLGFFQIPRKIGPQLHYWVRGIALLVVLLGIVLGFFAWGKWYEYDGLGKVSLEDIKVATICADTTPQQICSVTPYIGHEKQLTNSLTFSWIHPFFSWSPDGKQLLFAAETPGWPIQIHLLDLNDPEAYHVSLLGEGVFPVWSPNGEWIAFQRSSELWIMRPDGSEPQQLSSDVCAEGIAWSPDSRWLAFLDGVCSESGKEAGSIQITRSDGREMQVVHAFEKPVVGDLAWSPDGSQIVCFCIVEGGEEGNWLFNVDGSGRFRKLSEPPFSWRANYWPQWAGEN